MEELKRIIVKGGVISPSELKQVISYAESLGLDALHFGSRQDILLPEHHFETNDLHQQFEKVNSSLVFNTDYQNIVSSYVASDIFAGTTWLSSAAYLYILESFKFNPKLKINIVDPLQQLVPLFTGNLNYIASSHEDYWYLYIKVHNWSSYEYYPLLIYTWDIAKISKAIEEVIDDTEDVEELQSLISSMIEANSRTIEDKLKLTFKPFPYYEGMNKMGINQYWLGLYWRNNRYYLSFLRAFCDFCLDNRIGKICITPWKSFIVKGVPRSSKLQLEKLLGNSGINIRHSLLELNWHLPVNNEEALSLKRDIVRNFDQNDISTYGLTFGLSHDSTIQNYFTSIVIEKNNVPEAVLKYGVRPTYNVLYSENFDPNTQKYISYAQDVDKIELSGLLMELSRKYFEQFDNESVENNDEESVLSEPQKRHVHQCQDCLTVYDESLGDKNAAVEAFTPFNNLDENYQCDVCGSPKKNFILVEI
ncbi:hypothetical protein KH5_16620 [Urechidicola sp. KH5]